MSDTTRRTAGRCDECDDTGVVEVPLPPWSVRKPCPPCVQRVRTMALDLMEPDDVDGWMARPNPSLGGESPTTVINIGGVDRVMALLHALADGAYL